MTKGQLRAFVAGWMLFFANGEGFAADSEVQGGASPNTSTASSSFFDRASELFTVNYYGVYRGASLSQFGSSLQPTINGDLDPGNPLSLENQFTLSYKLRPDLNAGIQAHFMYYPAGKPSGTGQSLENLDPVFIVNWLDIAGKGGFKLNGRFTADLPLTTNDFLRRHQLMTGLAIYAIASYNVPETPLTLGLYSYLKGYIPAPDAPADAMTYKLYACPNANYQLQKNLSISLWVDLFQLSRSRGTGFFSGLVNPEVDVEPGISWDITKDITVNPFFNIYPAHPTLSATSFQAIIMARAL